MIRAQLRRLIARVSHTEKHCALRSRGRIRFDLDDVAGVLRVLFDGVEMNAAHGVLHIELILKTKRNRLGVADDEKIVRHLVGIGRTRPAPFRARNCCFDSPGRYARTPLYSW